MGGATQRLSYLDLSLAAFCAREQLAWQLPLLLLLAAISRGRRLLHGAMDILGRQWNGRAMGEYD
jgi:hypothetical protein